jgi:uncharacterized membrane protein
MAPAASRPRPCSGGDSHDPSDDGNGAQHGYLLEQGRFTTVDVPGAAATDAFGINDRGQIVGAIGPAPAPQAQSAMGSGPPPVP